MSEIKNKDQEILNKAVEDGGSYGIIKRRLETEGQELKVKVESLNNKRQDEFGGSKNEIIGKINVRTQNNCVPIDMAQIGGNLLLGYDVFLGMKSEVNISDVFAMYKIDGENGNFHVEEIPTDGTFLDDPEFVRSFKELFQYYKDAKLLQITKSSNYLLASFRIGKEVGDLRVYRWHMKNDGSLEYKDDRGNTDIKPPASHNFDWIETDRKNHITGKYPHVSILDKVFVETTGGDLTIKLENNTTEGVGIYSESVNDANQSLEDAKISYAEIGSLILLKVLPYREDNYRYFVFNGLTESVVRIDSIGNSCIQLPENHGITFPNGYYLENGEYKVFDEESLNLSYFQTMVSPNGEDYLYFYFDPYQGFYTLYSYNLIQKKLANPIHAHGYSLYEDGKFVIFRVSENTDPTKVHSMRVWQTPYVTDEFFANQERNNEPTFLSNIGNAELVRGVSDLYTVCNYTSKDEVSTSLYEGLIKTANKLLDDYHWLSDDNVDKISETLQLIIGTSELVVEEFEKVKSIQKQAKNVLIEAEKLQKDIISESKLTSKTAISENVQVLSKIKGQLGHLISIKEQRYIDIDKVLELEKEINDVKDTVNQSLLNVLQDEKSFDDYFVRIEKIESSLEKTEKVVEIEPLELDANVITDEIDLINNEVNEIEVDDATVVTRILDTVSEVFAKLNQLKSKIKNKTKSFRSTEAKSEFASQFKLLSQSVSSSISKSETPDKCDEELSRLMSQVESLESKFSDFDEFLTEITTKREEIQDLFESHKLQLINALQKRTANIENAASITITSIGKKVLKFNDIDKLNAYFASDAMVLKIHKFINNIRELGDVIRADDLESKLKKIKDQSLRSLRDNKDIFEDGGNIMKMGKHRFNVNKNDVELTTLPIDGSLTAHLTGTDFYERIENDELNSLKEYWDLDLVSETSDIYRGEYLAYSVLSDAEQGVNDLNLGSLLNAEKTENELLKIIQKYSSVKYKEGYIKGVHDHDAEKILSSILKVYNNSGLLKFGQKVRALTLLLEAKKVSDKESFNPSINNKESVESYKRAKLLSEKLGNFAHLSNIFKNFSSDYLESELDISEIEAYEMANYLNEFQLANSTLPKYEVEVTSDAYALQSAFRDFQTTELNLELSDEVSINNFNDIKDWIGSFVEHQNKDEWKYFIDEATIIHILNHNEKFTIKERGLKLTSKIEKLLGEHTLIENGNLTVTLDDFIARGKQQKEVIAPNYERYLELRQEIAHSQRESLKLDDFKAKPIASFVRNKLITDSYLHLIGDNFAKQIGTVGDSKRTDLMGLLLLISPPGYGKTTLIEYVANKLGLVFMKINCPSLNHSVVSLDPNEAPDATSRKELEKLNLGLEMGNNVLLYLDDIQHTSSEFLQKFISLCDGTRKIDGVWKGKPKTYDMKGKKFAVVMAGNPYTETGESFKIPDMLSNRADVYNLGDQMSGQEGIFELSYIENSLTSNSVLAPLANRSLDDLYKLVKMAQGENVPLNELEHNYSPAEANEIVNVLKKMITIQEVVLRVNQQYIISASVEDKYREEPSFRLQGSYRNMNKMTEKVVPVMNDNEIQDLILDHYKGESQVLTVGSEDNYLKLKSMMNIMTEEEENRWNDILSDFKRHKLVGDADTDGSVKIANQLNVLTEKVGDFFDSQGEGTDVTENDNSIKIAEQLIVLNKQMGGFFELQEQQSTKDIVEVETDDSNNDTLITAIESIHSESNKNNEQIRQAMRDMIKTLQNITPNPQKDDLVIEALKGFNEYVNQKLLKKKP